MERTLSFLRRYYYQLIGVILLPAGALAQNVTNYTFSSAAGSYTQIQGLPGAISPALTAGTLDDGYFNSKPIGFPFNFEGVTYSTFSASTNGWFTLGNTLSSAANANNLTTSTPRPIIAPLWDDIALPSAGNFTYYLSGNFPNRILTIEWLNAKWFYNAPAAGISFQVKLYESSKRIEFIYRQEIGGISTTSASIGIAGVTSGNFLSLNGTGVAPTASSVTETTTLNAKPATGQIYRFDPYLIKPIITGVTPLVGPTNTTVTISGNNFEISPSSNTVFFGATKATVLTSTSTQLTVSVPAQATLEPLTVTTNTQFRTETAPLAFDVTFNCGGVINASSYNPKVDYALTGFSRYIAASDIDGDGKTDLAVSGNSSGGSIAIFQNTTTPSTTINASSFAAPFYLTPAISPSGIIFNDLDGEGKKDLIFCEYNIPASDSVVILRNVSTVGVINASSFTQRTAFRCGSYPHVAAEDIDGDGKPELIIASQVGNTLEIKQNTTAPGVFNTTSFAASGFSAATGTMPYDIATGDLDGNGKPDVVIPNYSSNTISVFRNTAVLGTINASSLAPKVDFSTFANPISLKLCDFDNDGKLDVIVANQIGLGACVSVFRNTSSLGVISFATRQDFAAANSPSKVDVSDIDGDGKPDFVVVDGGSSQVHIFKNTSSAGAINFSNSASFPSGSNTFSLVATDLNSDSKPEISVISNVSSTSTHLLSVLQNIISPLTVIAPSTVTGSTSFCDDNTWKTYYDPLNPSRVLAAIKDNGNNLGATTVTEYKDAAPGNYVGIRFLARHFKITPTTQPSSSVQVRLYFTNAELAALQAVDPSVLTTANLSVTKYDGPTEDGTYYPLDATSLVWIPQASVTPGTSYSGNYLEFTISSFSEFWIHSGSGPLPIELLDFNATPKEDHVELNWSTATETNNDFFTIEKTQDGITFETVGRIDGAGTCTTIHNYATNDPNPYSGTSYYRLKQTDFNGQFTYSEFKEVQFVKEDELFSVFPNPGNGIVNFTCPGEKDAMISLRIFDNTGRIVSEKEMTIEQLEHQSVELNQGIYAVVVIRGNTRFIRQLVVI